MEFAGNGRPFTRKRPTGGCIMRIVRWLRREVLLPLLFLVVSGGALYWITQKLYQMEKLSSWNLLKWLLVACFAIYLLLAVISLRHIATTYLLERYNPGDPRSVRRLLRKIRYSLPAKWDGNAFVKIFPAQLSREGFSRESGDRLTGIVFARSGRTFWTRRRRIDRVIVLETSMIDIFRVDQLLKDCIYQLDRVERKSQRNVLVISVRMEHAADVASAAAGCVNFLGRFQSGTLFPVLVDLNRKRVYYPANRSAISRIHRFFQNRMLLLIRLSGPAGRSEERQDVVKKAKEQE